MANRKMYGVAQSLNLEENVYSLTQSVKDLWEVINRQSKELVELRKEVADKVGKATFQAAMLSKASRTLTERELESLRLQMEKDMKKELERLSKEAIDRNNVAEHMDKAEMLRLTARLTNLEEENTKNIREEVRKYAAMHRKKTDENEATIEKLQTKVTDLHARIKEMEWAGARRDEILRSSNEVSRETRSRQGSPFASRRPSMSGAEFYYSPGGSPVGSSRRGSTSKYSRSYRGGQGSSALSSPTRIFARGRSGLSLSPSKRVVTGVVSGKVMEDMFSVRVENGKEVVVHAVRLRVIQEPSEEYLEVPPDGQKVEVGNMVKFLQGHADSASPSHWGLQSRMSPGEANFITSKMGSPVVDGNDGFQTVSDPIGRSDRQHFKSSGTFGGHTPPVDKEQEPFPFPEVQQDSIPQGAEEDRQDTKVNQMNSLAVSSSGKRINPPLAIATAIQNSSHFHADEDIDVFEQVANRLHQMEMDIESNVQDMNMVHAQMKIMEAHHRSLSDENAQFHKAQAALKEQMTVVESTLSQLGNQVVTLLHTENGKLSKNEQMIGLLKSRVDRVEGKEKDVHQDLKVFKNEFKRTMEKVNYKLRRKDRNERVDDGFDKDSMLSDSLVDPTELVQPIADQARNLKLALQAALLELDKQQTQNRTMLQAYDYLVQEIRVLHENNAVLREAAGLHETEVSPPLRCSLVSPVTTGPNVVPKGLFPQEPPKMPYEAGSEANSVLRDGIASTESQKQLQLVMNSIDEQLKQLQPESDGSDNSGLGWSPPLGKLAAKKAIREAAAGKWMDTSNASSKSRRGWTPSTAVPSSPPAPPDKVLLEFDSKEVLIPWKRPMSGRSYKLASLPGVDSMWSIEQESKNQSDEDDKEVVCTSQSKKRSTTIPSLPNIINLPSASPEIDSENFKSATARV